MLRDALTSQESAIAVMNAQVTIAQVGEARRDLQHFRAEFGRFADNVDRRLGALSDASTRLLEHQQQMAQQLGQVAEATQATAGDVRFLLDASFGRMPIPAQIAALRRGVPSTLPKDDRERAALRLEAVQRLQSAGAAVGVVGDAAQLALALGSRVGITPGSPLHGEIVNLASNVQTAQQVLGLVTAFAMPGGGFLAAMPAITSLLGGGGSGGPTMPPGLQASLDRIEATLAEVNRKLGEILDLQRETIARLETMRLQMIADRDRVLGRIEDVRQLIIESLPALEGETANSISACLTVARELSRPEQHQLLLGLEARRVRFERDSSIINDCLDWLRPRQVRILSPDTGALAGEYHLPLYLLTRNAAAAEPEKRRPDPREALYRALADYTYALHGMPQLLGSDADALFRCHLRVFALLAAAPNYFAAVPRVGSIACPLAEQTEDAEAALPVGMWRPDARLPDVRAWRLTDAPLSNRTVTLFGEIISRTGEWRSVMRRVGHSGNEHRRAILTHEEAFGDGGIPVHPGLWASGEGEEHAQVVRYFGDVLDAAIARETLLSGGPLAVWVSEGVFDPNLSVATPTGDDNPTATVSTVLNVHDRHDALGKHAGPVGSARAWQLLMSAQDDPHISEKLETWFAQMGGLSTAQRARPLRVIDAVRLLFGEKFQQIDQEDHVLADGDAAAQARRRTLLDLLHAAGMPSPDSPTAAELAFLQEIAWLTDFNQDEDGLLAAVACRLLTVEKEILGQLERPTRRFIERSRGSNDDAQRLSLDYARRLTGMVQPVDRQ